MTLPVATVGVSYRGQLSMRGGGTPYRWSVSAGVLPPGLRLDESSGEILGTPANVGTFQFSISATDSAGTSKTKGASIQVLPTPSSQGSAVITISPATTSVSSTGRAQFAATSGGTSAAVTWSATVGTISSSGLFTAPPVSTTTSARITATSVADHSSSASASITVTPATSLSAPIISISRLPIATTGAPYAATISGSGGTPPYTWSVGSLPSGLVLDSTSGAISGTTLQPGNFSLQVTLRDAASQSATTNVGLTVVAPPPANTGFDGPAELPRVYMNSAAADTPAAGRIIPVGQGADLQAALNSANCGDTLELQAGSVFSGNYLLPTKSCDDQHWIIVRTAAPDSSLPPENVRMTPCYAGVSGLSGRPALNCASTQNVLARITYSGASGSGPLTLSSGANHYRLLGLEITRASGTGNVGGLLEIQRFGAANHIVLDRVWMHGTAQDETGHGVHLNGATYFAIVDSYFSDFHCISATGACTDAQAVVGGSGTVASGVFKIVGNFLEASGENILFGGGPSTVTPADIEIRRNHLFKPLTWMKGQANFVGGANGNPFIVKNHLELKNAQRVLAEGNILENSWGGFSQLGFSILLTPKNQTLNGVNTCPACQVTDVTIRFSTISHVGDGFQIATVLSDGGGAASGGGRFSIHDVVVDDINAQKYAGAGSLIALYNGWSTNVLHDVTLNHITGFPDPGHHVLSLLDVAPKPPMPAINITNNIFGTTAYPVWSAGGGLNNCAYSNVPVTSIATCFLNGSFIANGLIGASSSYMPSKWPSNNLYAASPDEAQFANYNAANGGDYHLLSSSPYKNAGNDGKDLGADLDAIQAAISGVN